jgi:hypothetical protein
MPVLGGGPGGGMLPGGPPLMGPTGGGMHVGPGHPFFADRWATATTASLSTASVACLMPQKGISLFAPHLVFRPVQWCRELHML